MRLTLRTLLAYLDDTLDPAEARNIGQKVAENPAAQELVDRIKRVTRRRGLATPPTGLEGSPSDPNTVADYLNDTLGHDQVAQFEQTCLESDVHLAEVAACHQILTLVLSEQIRVPPTARQRMYQLVKGRESIPDRKPGNTIPIGGTFDTPVAPEGDDIDAPLLLGLTAYSSSESMSGRLRKVGALVLLLAGLGGAIFMALPASDRTPPDTTPQVALVTVPKTVPIETPPATTRPDPKIEPAPKPSEKPETKVEPPPMPKPPVEPPPTKELVPTIPAPKAERVALGKIDRTGIIVVHKLPDEAMWERVNPDEPVVMSTEPLMALPGFKAPLRLETGVTVELWGNLPELFPAPLLESAITPYLPQDGFDADLALKVGRIYLSTKKPAGSKIRLRFASEVWDITLADAKSEVVFELTHALVPGEIPEAPRISAGMAVREGQASLTLPLKDPVKLPKGGEAYWDSKGGKPDIRPQPKGPLPQAMSYWSRLPIPPQADRAEASLAALAGFAKRLTDPRRVRATYDEALQPKDERPTLQDIAAARIAVLTFAALEDLPGMVDTLGDPNRQLLRSTAGDGLRTTLAKNPNRTEELKKIFIEKLRLKEEEIEEVFRLLRGFSERERSDPATLDRLFADLSSPALPIRELASMILFTAIDPSDKANDPLFRFDAGAPNDFREAAIKAWKKKIEELKGELGKPATPSPMPTPPAKK